MRRSTAFAAVGLAVLALVGCASGDADPGDAVDPSGIREEDFSDGVDAPAGDAGLSMPPECATVSVGWYPGIDIANVDNMPADWPAPPAGSTLCSTMDGGSIETAAYASALEIDEIFAFYEEALPSSYSAGRISGADNGTGYASLDGNGPGVAFQVRENDGGFTLAFANEAN